MAWPFARIVPDGVRSTGFSRKLPPEGGITNNRPRITDESTTFVIPTGSTLWYHDLNGHYEGAPPETAA